MTQPEVNDNDVEEFGFYQGTLFGSYKYKMHVRAKNYVCQDCECGGYFDGNEDTAMCWYCGRDIQND